MERGLMSRFSNIVFIGLPCAKMLMNTSKGVTNVKEQVDSLEGMKCHCRAF